MPRYQGKILSNFMALLIIVCGSLMIYLWTNTSLVPQAFANKSVEAESLLDRLKDQHVTMRSEDLSVALFLRSLGKKGGINVLVDDNIKDTMTINVEDMSLYNLFMAVVESKHLKYSEKNQVVFVGKAGETDQLNQDVITTQLCPQHGSAADYLDQLTPLLSDSGVLTVSERNNCFIAQDREEIIERIQDMLTRLDVPFSQIHIKASIVSVSKEAKKQLGINWGFSNTGITSDGVNYPIEATSDLVSTGNLIFGIMHGNLDLDIELNALAENDLVRILSSPQILVLDGKEAEIKQGQEVAYVAQSGDNLNTSFREANLSLKVTPNIRGSLINLNILVNNDSVDPSSTGGEPLINTQEISTELLLKDGVTVVIGGIILDTDDNEKDNVPGLSSIPLIGALFRNSAKEKSRSELLVFITPNIISLADSAEVSKKANLFIEDYTGAKLLSESEMEKQVEKEEKE